MPLFSEGLRKLLQGTPFGAVYPPRAPPPPLAVDGRTIALRILRKYITELTFFLPGPVGKAPIPFQIQEKDIHIEWPDAVEDLKFPSIVLLSDGPADYATIGLTSYLEEDTRDVYGQGTVVQWQSEYTEMIALEIWATKKPERRSILAGLEVALTPTEQMYGLRFRMPDYFNEMVCFSAQGRQLFDDPDSARGRRHARIRIEMRHNLVALVNYLQVVPTVQTIVDTDDTGVVVDLDNE